MGRVCGPLSKAATARGSNHELKPRRAQYSGVNSYYELKLPVATGGSTATRRHLGASWRDRIPQNFFPLAERGEYEDRGVSAITDNSRRDDFLSFRNRDTNGTELRRPAGRSGRHDHQYSRPRPDDVPTKSGFPRLCRLCRETRGPGTTQRLRPTPGPKISRNPQETGRMRRGMW
jgi:hypothetical protein